MRRNIKIPRILKINWIKGLTVSVVFNNGESRIIDFKKFGEIAKNLRSLYLFMNKRLAEANTKLDTQIINEVISLMEELNQSWKAITG